MSKITPMNHIKVACAVIINQNKILAAKRSTSMPHPGFWEFPGGKIEAGEKAEDSLIREIKEELNCAIMIQKALPVFCHSYIDKNIELFPFICSLNNEELVPTEHEEVKWLSKDELNSVHWLHADIAIKNYLLGNILKIGF